MVFRRLQGEWKSINSCRCGAFIADFKYIQENIHQRHQLTKLTRKAVELTSFSLHIWILTCLLNIFFQDSHKEMFCIQRCICLQEHTFAELSFLMKFQAVGLQPYQKDTPAQVFSCKCCEMFQSTIFRTPMISYIYKTLFTLEYFTEHLPQINFFIKFDWFSTSQSNQSNARKQWFL